MALDAATLALTAAELKATLTDAKIAKIFEPTRDELVITLRTRTLRQFTIGHVRHRLVAKVEIIDNGPGIPTELQDTIFYPMVSGRADGTGLGLAITQNIISQHQGLIECESHPGHTVFSIFLPLEQGAVSS